MALGINVVLLLARAADRCSTSDVRALAATVQDDSFYYVLPAFRFWEHGFWTFDGEHPTFGVQPAFAWFLTALAAPFDDRFAFFRAALWTNYLFFAGAAVGIAAFLRRLLRPCGELRASLAASLGAHGFLLSGTLLYGFTTLKENALYALLLSLSLYAVLVARSRPSRWTLPACGFLAGLAISCRLTPSTLLVAGVSLLFAAGRPRIRRSLLLAAGLAAAVLPWAIHALLTYGRLLPTSGTLKTQGFRSAVQHGTLGEHLPRLLSAVVPYLSEALRYSFGRPSTLFLPQGAPATNAYSTFFPLLLIGLPLVAVRRHALRACPGAWLVPLAALAALLGTAMNPILLGVDRMHEVRRYYTWYVADLPVLLCMLAPLAACLCPPSKPSARGSRWRAPGVGASVGGLLVLLGIPVALRVVPLGELRPRPDSWSTQMIAIADRANEVLEPSARIASYNAGVVGFLSDATVVNFDGLANDDILAARSRGTTDLQYLRENHIPYLVDPLRPSGWFGNAFDRLAIVSAVPFHLEVPEAERAYYDGYFLLQVTEERFPSFEPAVEQGGVRVVPWLATDPLGSTGEATRCLRFQPLEGAATATFHTVRTFREMRFRAGREQPASPGVPATLSLYAEDGRLLHRSSPLDATSVSVPCLEVDTILVEVTAPSAPEGAVPVTWLTGLAFDWGAPATPGEARVQTYGEGCSASAGPTAAIPRLEVLREGAPTAEEFHVVVSDGPPAAPGFLGIGLTPTSLRLRGGCRVLFELTPEVTLLPFVTDAQGRWEDRIPAAPDVPGAFRYAQALFRDPAEPDRFSAVTNGVRVWVGSDAAAVR